MRISDWSSDVCSSDLHARERVSQQMATNLGLSVLSIATGVPADLGSKFTDVMFTLPNSRTHETEADLMGVELAARAGYDPRAAVTLWQKMGRPTMAADRKSTRLNSSH